MLALVVALPTAEWGTGRFGRQAMFASTLLLFVVGSTVAADA